MTIPGHPTLGAFESAKITVASYYETGGIKRVLSLPLGRFPQVDQLLAQALEAFDRLYEATPDPDPSDGSLSVEGVPDDDTPQGLLLVDLGALVRAMATRRPPTPTGDGGDDGYDDAFRHVTQMAEEQGPPPYP